VDQDTIRTIITAVSALAASASTFFAARTLVANNEARRAEFDSARPYFTFFGYRLERVGVHKSLTSELEFDPTRANIKGSVANRGLRRAANVAGSLFILPLDTRAQVGVFPLNVGDDIAPGSEWEVKSGQLQIIDPNYPGRDVAGEYRDPGFHVCVALEYEDPLASKRHVQMSFLKWPGISGGVVATDLVAATGEEKNALVVRHRPLLARYISP
jgi:hypothetical protein